MQFCSACRIICDCPPECLMRMLQEAVPLHGAAAELAAQQGGPTAVPRNTGVADGPWSATDASLVAGAMANDVPAPRVRKTRRFAEHGA